MTHIIQHNPQSSGVEIDAGHACCAVACWVGWSPLRDSDCYFKIYLHSKTFHAQLIKAQFTINVFEMGTSSSWSSKTSKVSINLVMACNLCMLYRVCNDNSWKLNILIYMYFIILYSFISSYEQNADPHVYIVLLEIIVR